MSSPNHLSVSNSFRNVIVGLPVSFASLVPENVLSSCLWKQPSSYPIGRFSHWVPYPASAYPNSWFNATNLSMLMYIIHFFCCQEKQQENCLLTFLNINTKHSVVKTISHSWSTNLQCLFICFIFAKLFPQLLTHHFQLSPKSQHLLNGCFIPTTHLSFLERRIDIWGADAYFSCKWHNKESTVKTAFIVQKIVS